MHLRLTTSAAKADLSSSKTGIEKWQRLIGSSSPAYPAASRALQRVSMHVGKKMQEVKGIVHRKDAHYMRLANARSSQDVMKIEQDKQYRSFQRFANLPSSILKSYSPTVLS